MKVVLVEDDIALRSQLARYISALPNSNVVAAVSTQSEACDWFSKNPDEWDLALIDLFLAEGNGFKVLHSCLGRKPSQKAVVVSNYVREPVREYVKAAGADAFFDKSLELDDLIGYCGHLAQTETAHS